MRDKAIGGFAFASAVRASTTYSATAANGVQVGAVPIRNGATTLGALSLHLARDANNILGYYLTYTGASGSHNFALDLSDLAAGFIPNDQPKPRLQGRRMATWTSPGGTRTYDPTQGDRLPSWSRESGVNIILPNHRRYLALNNYRPTANCFGYLFVAKISGSEVARAVLTLGPSSVADLVDEESDVADIQYGLLTLGFNDPNVDDGGQFLRIRYRALRNGSERLSLLAYPNRFTGTDGAADRRAQLPANLTVDLYEAVIG